MDPFLLLFTPPDSLEAELGGQGRRVLGGHCAVEEKAGRKQILNGSRHVGARSAGGRG